MVKRNPEIIVSWDETPAQWFSDDPDVRLEIAAALHRHCDDMEGRDGLNLAAWIIAFGGITTMIGGVVGFGLLVAWLLSP